MTGMPEDSRPLVDWEKAVRPLRRVLSLAPERAGDPLFAASCARLARSLRGVVLPSPHDADAAEILAAFDGLDGVDEAGRVSRLHRVGALVRRLDERLGLPLSVVDMRVRPVVEPPADTAAADATPAAEPERRGKRHGRDERRTDRAGRPDRRDQPVQTVEVPLPAAAPSEPSSEAAEDADDLAGSLLAGARWDSPVADIDLPDDLIDAAAALGLDSVWDALTLRPTREDTLAPVHGAGRELPDGQVAVGGRVRARWTVLSKDGSRRSAVGLVGAGALEVRWRRAFREADMLRLEPGAKVVVIGDVVRADDGTTRLEQGALATAAHGQCHPVDYGAGVHEDDVRDLIGALSEDTAQLEEPLPSRTLETTGVRLLVDAVAHAHGRGMDAESRRRLAFDEAFVMELASAIGRFDNGQERGVVNPAVHGHISDLTVRLELEPLGDAAQAALEVIKRELRSPTPMQRVLVGSTDAGVDDVVLQALLIVAESRHQVAVVLPEVPYATALFDRWESTLRAYGLSPLLVTGEARRADRDALKRGEHHVVIGTAAALEPAIEWRRLGLVVAYEQAVYGDMAARVRTLKSPRPDVLVVARSALPGSVLASAWSRWDLSVLPASGAPTAEGRVWKESEREEAYRALAEDVRAGKPGLILFPFRRQGTDLFTLREATALIETLRAQIFDGASIALFHGATSEKDRQRAWTDFLERRAQVLLATVPVEWMPTSPRAVSGLVEYADRVDLQRLLAMRAQLSGGTMHYVLGAEPEAPRLAWVHALADATSDEVLTERAAELFTLTDNLPSVVPAAWRWFEPARDGAVLVQARGEALRIAREDPQLRLPQHGRLLRFAHVVWRRLAGDVKSPFPDVRASAARKKRRKRRRR